MEQLQESEILARIKKGDEPAFRKLFDTYYKYLLVTVSNITGDRNLARDISQDVFLTIWRKRADLNIKNAKSYLRRAAVNRTLNYIKAQRMDFQEPENLPETITESDSAQKQLEAQDLQKVINETIENLPKKCRAVFTLCRLEGFSHKEIAAKMDISTKTVENQMTKALKILRVAVAPYVKGLVVLFMGIL